MYRLTYDLGKVGKYMNLKVSFIAKDDQFNTQSIRKQPIFSKFKFKGSDYLNINPRPYITIEITDPLCKNESSGFDPTKRINLNRYGVFWLKKAIAKIKNNFINMKDLYYYYEGRLTIQTDRANEASYSMIVNNKRITLKPTIIEDSETHVYHEGILFCINDESNHAPLNYAELEYLYDIICNINFESIMTLLLVSDESNLTEGNRGKFIITNNEPVAQMEPSTSINTNPQNISYK